MHSTGDTKTPFNCFAVLPLSVHVFCFSGDCNNNLSFLHVFSFLLQMQGLLLLLVTCMVIGDVATNDVGPLDAWFAQVRTRKTRKPVKKPKKTEKLVFLVFRPVFFGFSTGFFGFFDWFSGFSTGFLVFRPVFRYFNRFSILLHSYNISFIAVRPPGCHPGPGESCSAKEGPVEEDGTLL